MQVSHLLKKLIFLAVLTAVLPQAGQSQVVAGSSSANTAAKYPAAAEPWREFDFDLGRWKTHSTRLLHPLTGSNTWVTMDGYTTVTSLLGGRANMADYKANGPAGEIQLVSLRWYNSTTGEWSLDFATPGVGQLGGTPGVGKFKDGRADFYDQESIGGKTIWVKFSIWGIDSQTAQSEQAFSADGGKTWEINWINKYERIPD